MKNVKGALPYEKRHLNGVKLGRKDAILAKCYECMGGYDCGKVDCKAITCPLYDYYPYKRDKS